MILNGTYNYNEKEIVYEIETTYQLKYYICCALMAIDRIIHYSNDNGIKFDNKAQYYHFYSDSLFNSIGKITNRFSSTQVEKSDKKKSKKKELLHDMRVMCTLRNEKNRINYDFNEKKYDNLCNKKPRNIIEHLDEYNVLSIMENGAVGGFNVIQKESKNEMAETLRNNRRYYPYLLDLNNNEFLFYNAEAGKGNEEFSISIDKLLHELEVLKESVIGFEKNLDAYRDIRI